MGAILGIIFLLGFCIAIALAIQYFRDKRYWAKQEASDRLERQCLALSQSYENRGYTTVHSVKFRCPICDAESDSGCIDLVSGQLRDLHAGRFYAYNTKTGDTETVTIYQKVRAMM